MKKNNIPEQSPSKRANKMSRKVNRTGQKSRQQTGPVTIGLDLGDKSSRYCVLNEAGQVVLERSVGSSKKAMTQVFGAMPRCPWKWEPIRPGLAVYWRGWGTR